MAAERLREAGGGDGVLDFDEELGRDSELRCTVGYNLNARGSELVGERLAQGLLERRIEREAAAIFTTE